MAQQYASLAFQAAHGSVRILRHDRGQLGNTVREENLEANQLIIAGDFNVPARLDDRRLEVTGSGKRMAQKFRGFRVGRKYVGHLGYLGARAVEYLHGVVNLGSERIQQCDPR